MLEISDFQIKVKEYSCFWVFLGLNALFYFCVKYVFHAKTLQSKEKTVHTINLFFLSKIFRTKRHINDFGLLGFFLLDITHLNHCL